MIIANNSLIGLLYFSTYVLPSNTVTLFLSFRMKILVESRIGTYSINSIGHRMNVPIICLHTFAENFRTSRLLGDDRRYAALHSLERRDSKRFRNGRHNIYIAHFKHFVDLFSAHKAREVETIANTSCGHQANHLIHHIAVTSHHET